MTDNHGDDEGSLSVELAVLVPGIVLFLLALMLAGRLVNTSNTVKHAAEIAARAASLDRNAAAAASDANAAGTANLAAAGLDCTNATQVSEDLSGYSIDPGTPAVVKVTVTCTIKLSDLGLPGVPASKTVTETAISPLDEYRSRR